MRVPVRRLPGMQCPQKRGPGQGQEESLGSPMGTDVLCCLAVLCCFPAGGREQEGRHIGRGMRWLLPSRPRHRLVPTLAFNGAGEWPNSLFLGGARRGRGPGPGPIIWIVTPWEVVWTSCNDNTANAPVRG